MIVKLRKILESHSCETIKWDDGEELVDVQTANVICKVYDAASRELQYKLQAKMNQSVNAFRGVAVACWSCVS